MILYHASQHKTLKALKPQRTLSNDKYIGDFVFATANRTMAIMYLVPPGIATLMNPDKNNPNIVICATVDEFTNRDHGGTIYELPSDSFADTPQEGLSEYEMVSSIPVQPLHKTTFDSSLKALLSAGIQVRFIDEPTFKSLLGNPNQEKMFKQIKPYARP